MKQITCIFMAAFLSLAVFAGERPARQIQIGKKNTAVATAVDTEIVVAPDAPQTTLFRRKGAAVFPVADFRQGGTGSQTDFKREGLFHSRSQPVGEGSRD